MYKIVLLIGLLWHTTISQILWVTTKLLRCVLYKSNFLCFHYEPQSIQKKNSTAAVELSLLAILTMPIKATSIQLG